MSNLFKDKTAMPPDGTEFPPRPMPMMHPPGTEDSPVRTSQTLSEFHASRRADDAMSVRNINRPRYGKGM